MPTLPPTLPMVCGKIAAGKSTLVACLASAPSTIPISEDHWMSCRARLKRRNAAGTHGFVVSDEEFDEITRHFMLPTGQAGFEMVFHRET